MKIQSMYHEYEADFDPTGSFADTLARQQNAYVVVDKNVLELYSDLLSPLLIAGHYYVLDAVEENKTVAKALEIMDHLVALETKRNTLLVAIGGGITQDVVCFIASVLYRGISWYFVPTTLLAQTDSCIGSKSSINYNKFKNLIGTFYPPMAIYIYPQFLRTLSHRDYLSGLGEIAKIAIMYGRDGFYVFRNTLPQMLARDEQVLRAHIEKSLDFKKAVIEIDEFDRDYRNIMNYGHTFGHALETESTFAVPHGQAVTAGCLIANEISTARGLISKAYRDDMRCTLTKILQLELFRSEWMLPDGLIKAMHNDKKYSGNAHTCILADESGAKKFCDISDDEIKNALTEIQVYWDL